MLIFWGIILLVVVISLVFRVRESMAIKKSENQVQGEEHARSLDHKNMGGPGPGGGF
jgi:hypothetical protein